jgi:hypothetical protein
MAIKNTLKVAITIVLGISLLILFFINAVPSMLGNTTFTVWVGGTNYVWIVTILLFVMFIVAVLKVLDVI